MEALVCPPPEDRKSPRLGLLLGLLLFFVALSVQHAAKAKAGDHRSAILRWRQQILALTRDGEDVYQRYAYPNPPIMALLLTPVAALPDWTGLPVLACALV